jgi:hypothetical protein
VEHESILMKILKMEKDVNELKTLKEDFKTLANSIKELQEIFLGFYFPKKV